MSQLKSANGEPRKMKDQIKQLYKSGYNINTIAKKLGTTHHKVGWIVQQMQMSGE